MKNLRIFFTDLGVMITFLLFACNTLHKKKPYTSSEKESKNIFQYTSAKSNWLIVQAIINHKDTGTFVLDNRTSYNDVVIFDNDFALQSGLIPNKEPISIANFQRSSLVTLSFGDFKIDSKSNHIMDLPQRNDFNYSGIIGMGFLKNYIIEIDFQKNFFFIDSTLSVDTTNYYTFNLGRKNMYPFLPIEFYINGKTIIKEAALDLGDQSEGFYWGGEAAKKISCFKIDSSKIKKLIATTTGEMDIRMPFIFDSVSLPGNLISREVHSHISFSKNGISGANIVLFGNDFLRRFKKVYIDFRQNKLYLQRNVEDGNNYH